MELKSRIMRYKKAPCASANIPRVGIVPVFVETVDYMLRCVALKKSAFRFGSSVAKTIIASNPANYASKKDGNEERNC